MRYILSAELAGASLDTNVKNTTELQDILCALDVIRVHGVYKGIAETSFIVKGSSDDIMLALAKSFGQESILELNDDTGIATLIFTLSGGRLEIGRHVIVTELPAGCTAYTEVSNGIYLIVVNYVTQKSNN